MGAAGSKQTAQHLLVQATMAFPAFTKPVVDEQAVSHGVAPTEFLTLPLTEPLRKLGKHAVMQIGYEGLKFRQATKRGTSEWKHIFGFKDLTLWTYSGEKFIFYFEVSPREPNGEIEKHWVAVGHIKETMDAMNAVVKAYKSEMGADSTPTHAGAATPAAASSAEETAETPEKPDTTEESRERAPSEPQTPQAIRDVTAEEISSAPDIVTEDAEGNFAVAADVSTPMIAKFDKSFATNVQMNPVANVNVIELMEKVSLESRQKQLQDSGFGASAQGSLLSKMGRGRSMSLSRRNSGAKAGKDGSAAALKAAMGI